MHIAIKHLPKLHVIGSGARKRYLHVAIDRASRMVHLAVKDEETETCATAFLREAVAAFPFRVTHVLTDRGSCFTADGFEAACRALGVTAPHDQALHAADQRHGRTLQRPHRARGAGHVHRCSRRSGAPAGNASSRATHPTRLSASA